MNTTRFEEIRSLAISDEDYVVFGGTFDPFHQEHFFIVKQLSSYFRKVFIAPTVQNTHKDWQPTDLETRVKMINIVLDYEDSLTENIEILDFEYTYSEEVVDYLRTKHRGKLYWAVGEDIVGSVATWRNWQSLDVPMIAMPILVSIHSTDIRKDLKYLHPALVDFIKENKLYAKN